MTPRDIQHAHLIDGGLRWTSGCIEDDGPWQSEVLEYVDLDLYPVKVRSRVDFGSWGTKDATVHLKQAGDAEGVILNIDTPHGAMAVYHASQPHHEEET